MAPTQVLLFAFLIGFFAGLRSLIPPAVTAWATHLGWLKVPHVDRKLAPLDAQNRAADCGVRRNNQPGAGLGQPHLGIVLSWIN
jgi:hypothetical protein